jgi:hypothetical protein
LYYSKYRVRERIEYRFRVPSAAVFTLYSYSKILEYRLEYATAGSLTGMRYRLMAPSLVRQRGREERVERMHGGQRASASAREREERDSMQRGFHLFTDEKCYNSQIKKPN